MLSSVDINCFRKYHLIVSLGALGILEIYQGPHSFSFLELKTFLKTFFTTLTTYCKKFAILLRKLKIR